MATLGPVSRDETVLRGLVRAGVDLFRLNLSHGTQEQHRETLRRVRRIATEENCHLPVVLDLMGPRQMAILLDRKSTRLNSSHLGISYAVFCLKKKKK